MQDNHKILCLVQRTEILNLILQDFKGGSDWGKNERMKTKNNTKIAEKIIIRCHFVSKTALVIFLTALLAMILIACGIFIHLSVASMVEKLSSTLVHVYD